MHGLDEICFYGISLFLGVWTEQSFVQRNNFEGAILDFEKLIEVIFGNAGHFEMHFGDEMGSRSTEIVNIDIPESTDNNAEQN